MIVMRTKPSYIGYWEKRNCPDALFDDIESVTDFDLFIKPRDVELQRKLSLKVNKET